MWLQSSIQMPHPAPVADDIRNIGGLCITKSCPFIPYTVDKENPVLSLPMLLTKEISHKTQVLRFPKFVNWYQLCSRGAVADTLNPISWTLE